MDEYIKRAEVRSALEKINPVDFGGMMDYETHHGASEALRFAGYAIDDIPSANVAPVRHGHWEEIRNAYGELEGWIHIECGREVKCAEQYCPTCGAKMQ